MKGAFLKCQLRLFAQVAYSTERKECQLFLHRCGVTVKATKIDRANEFTKMYQKVKTLSWTKVNIHPSIFFFYSQVKLSKKMKEYWTFKILYDIHSFDVHNSTLVSALTLSWYSLYITMRWSKRKRRSLIDQTNTASWCLTKTKIYHHEMKQKKTKKFNWSNQHCKLVLDKTKTKITIKTYSPSWCRSRYLLSLISIIYDHEMKQKKKSKHVQLMQK